MIASAMWRLLSLLYAGLVGWRSVSQMFIQNASAVGVKVPAVTYDAARASPYE